MRRIGVCDDEDVSRAYLAALVRRQGVNCEVVEYASAEEYLSGGREHDLLFLDIQLGVGEGKPGWEGSPVAAGRTENRGKDAPAGAGTGERMDGMALARRIRSMEGKQPLIVFVTGYEEYVYEAFDVGAFNYLLKPIEEERFSEIFHRAMEVLEENSRPEAEKKISSAGCPGQENEKLLHIRCGSVNRAVPLHKICYLESQGHRVVLHLEGQEVEYYARIRDLEEALGEDFFRIHKGFLVALSHVESYSRTEVVLAGGVRLPVSKYKYGDFVKAYLRYLQQGGFSG